MSSSPNDGDRTIGNEEKDTSDVKIENSVKKEDAEETNNKFEQEKKSDESETIKSEQEIEKSDELEENKSIEEIEHSDGVENKTENSEKLKESPSKAEKSEKKSKKSKQMTQQKLKILALHGYRQNGEIFRQKTGSFRKLLHKYAQFTYITAPHKVIVEKADDNVNDVDIGQDPNSVEQYGWWFNRDDRTFRGARKGGPAIGFGESVKLIEETFKEHGPFDGLLGFSQGACLVGLLCDLQSRGLTTIKFEFAIIASGFKSGSLPHMKYYNEPIDLPTMHIYGLSDEIIPKEMSLALKEIFENGDTPPIMVSHPGGHFLPGNSVQKSVYQNFMKLRQLQKIHAEKLKETIIQL